MKLVKYVKKCSYKDECINKILSVIAIGSLLTSISLGTIGVMDEIEKKKDSGRSIPVSDEKNAVNSVKTSGVVYLSDDDVEDEKVEVMKEFDNTDKLFDIDNNYNDSFILFEDLFEQRPDLNILFDKLLYKIVDLNMEIDLGNNEIKKFLSCEDANNSDMYNSLLEENNKLIEERNILVNRKNDIVNMAIDYMSKKESLSKLRDELDKLERNNNQMNKQIDSASDVYTAKLMVLNDSKIDELENQIVTLERELYDIINSSIGIDDIKFLWNGYNSAYGYVPAGEWDSWLNPNYLGEGYLTGLGGSFQGMQGTETGYDSRKGALKSDYGDPDRALLKLLSQVTDFEGNYLYPMESFEKGGKYYYHIFGVNDDGTINYDLIDNPRFGLKMLGNYFIVGGDQRLLRERGSLVLTTLGPAIVIDNGKVDDLEADPNHIDMSMDEVLFWLKKYSHNSDKIVKSMAGIYKWCTPEDFDGVVDVSYEIMERNYVNNLNVQYDLELICFFDREQFSTETNYQSQDEFVLKLNR